MKIHREFQQGSGEWAMARAGVPTASEFDNLVDSKFEMRTGKMPKTYLAKKVAERWLGGPLLEFSSIDMDLGTILEEEARPFLQVELNREIETVGLITAELELKGLPPEFRRVACSPDGLFEDVTGIEIKCPAPHTHVGYLMSGKVPTCYLPQIHGGMLITGAERWTFASYCRRFPPLIITVERDDGIIESLTDALSFFLHDLKCGYEMLERMNGGIPRSLVASAGRGSRKEFEGDLSDVPMP